MTQFCPTCNRLVEADIELSYKDGFLISDRSTCTVCARVLWNWDRRVYNVGVPDAKIVAAFVGGKKVKVRTPKQGDLW